MIFNPADLSCLTDHGICNVNIKLFDKQLVLSEGILLQIRIISGYIRPILGGLHYVMGKNELARIYINCATISGSHDIIGEDKNSDSGIPLLERRPGK